MRSETAAAFNVTVAPSSSAYDALAAYLSVRPNLDAQGKIRLVDQAEALLRGGWDMGELVPVVKWFAEIDGDPCNLAWWASRRRSVRPWWVRD